MKFFFLWEREGMRHAPSRLNADVEDSIRARQVGLKPLDGSALCPTPEMFTVTTIDEVSLPSLVVLKGGYRSSITEGGTLEMNSELAPFNCLEGHVVSEKTWQPLSKAAGYSLPSWVLTHYLSGFEMTNAKTRHYSRLSHSYCPAVQCAEGCHPAVLC